MSDDNDIIDLLAADHKNLMDLAGGDDAVRTVVEHLTVERALLYPAAEKAVAGIEGQLEQLRRTDRDLEASASGHDDKFDGALQAHIDGLDRLFVDMRKSVSAEELLELGRQVPIVIAEAPTHFHPHIPDHGPLREITTEVAAEIDHLRDSRPNR